MTTEKAGDKDKVIEMVPRTTEEELRAEIDDLKRKLEDLQRPDQHGPAHALAHPKQPSRKALGAFALLSLVALSVAFVAGYLPRHRRDLQLVAEAKAQTDAAPEVSVVTAALAEANGELILPGNTQAVTAVHFQKIAVGRDFGDRIEVLSGLTPGAKVIVNPNDSVQEGAKVHPIAEAEGGPKRAGKPKE